MNSLLRERVNELEEIIKQRSIEYYSGNPTISDEEFDMLTDELKSIDPTNTLLTSVGFGLSTEDLPLKEVEHKVKMKNLPKIKVEPTVRIIDAVPSVRDTTDVVTYKIDGLACELVYEDGLFVKAITRGNGITGQDVTEVMRKVVPNQIPFKNISTITGEIIMTDKVYKQYYPDKFEEVSVRNVAAGLANRDNLTDEEISRLTFIMYRVTSMKTTLDSVSYKVLLDDFARLTDFNVVNYVDTSMTVKEAVVRGDYHNDSRVAVDGVVVCPDKLKVIDGIVDYSDAYAVKTITDTATTTVTDITWRMSKLGEYIPRVWFKKVNLSGADIQKASGCNIGYLRSLNIGIGAEISIVRSGEIIPKILSVVKPGTSDIAQPTTCVHCGSSLIEQDGHLMCTNEDCSGKCGNQIKTWINTMSYGLDGVGPALINDIIIDYNIKDISDLYRVNIDTLPTNTATNRLVKSVFEYLHKPRDLSYFLVACTIPKMSWTTAAKFVEEDNNLYQILSGTLTVSSVDQIIRPSRVNSSVVSYIYENLSTLQQLFSLVEITKGQPKESNDSLVKICITGSMEQYSTKSSFYKAYADKIVESSVTNCDYLISNDQSKLTSKLSYARSHDIKVVTEQEMIDILNEVK